VFRSDGQRLLAGNVSTPSAFYRERAVLEEEVVLDQLGVTARWVFLETLADACAVVTSGMEILYLNRAAREIVGAGWFLSRCWDVFPVWGGGCSARCPAVQAVRGACAEVADGDEFVYCEERLDLGRGEPIPLGVVVIGVDDHPLSRERGLLVLRPRRSNEDAVAFRSDLLDAAAEILVTVRSKLG